VHDERIQADVRPATQATTGVRPGGAEPAETMPSPSITLPPTDVMVVIFPWEKLRIVYNVVLLSFGIYYFNPLGILLFAPMLLPWALLANLCFCAGPFVECYLCLLRGCPRTGARWFVFLAGLVVSVSLVVYECEKFIPPFADK
jgi:hypothetical protein